MFQIAMIEDEEHTRQEVERLISREFEKLKVQDITTEIYKTAEEFLEVKKHYDVVISDIDLPGKSGIDLGRILKAEQKDRIRVPGLLFDGQSVRQGKYHASEDPG